MKNILILGANGQIAKLAEAKFLADNNVNLTLFLRNASRLSVTDQSREKVIEGDATDSKTLTDAMQGQTAVYANLAGSATIESQAKAVVQAMDATGLKRLVWISTLGIYDEVPGKFGEWNNQTLDGYLQPYAAAAKVIEQSDLDYTIIRPAWLTNKSEVDYETTQKGEPFKGTEVSRQSIADLVVKLAQDPTLEAHHSLGVNKPNTDGDKPAWY